VVLAALCDANSVLLIVDATQIADRILSLPLCAQLFENHRE